MGICSHLQQDLENLVAHAHDRRGVVGPERDVAREAERTGGNRGQLGPSEAPPQTAEKGEGGRGSTSLEAALSWPASGGARRLEGRVQKLDSYAKISGLEDV
jgi:hypothetical protein